MPRFVPDPSKVSFGIPLMQKGIYRVKLGKAKSFLSKADSSKDKKENYGIRYGATVVSSEDRPEAVGKTFTPINLYMHTEGAEQYSKGIYAKAAGCENDTEFNEQFADADFSYNTDDGSVGQFWHDLEEKLVDVICDEPTIDEKRNNGQPQTNITGFMVAK